MARSIRTATLLAWAAALVLASFAAGAQRVEGDRATGRGLYSAEVTVSGQGDAERRVAFARGLEQVLGKLSGDPDVASLPGVDRELRRAGDYVSSFDYRQDEGTSARGAPSYRTTLVVRFDDEQVDTLTSVLGVPVWPQPRPQPVLWLAIDDGSGPRLVGEPQAAAARSVLDRARERGYRLRLPEGTAAERALAGAIWRGDIAAVARASQRYGSPMQLIGKLYRADGGWATDWTFVDRGRELERWSERGSDARAVMATGAAGAATALTERYAKTEPAGPAGRYRITFTAIDSSEDFMRLSGYLQRLAVVRDIAPVRAGAQGLVLELDLLSGLSGLERAVGGDEVLVADDVGIDDEIMIDQDILDGDRLSTDADADADLGPTTYRLR